MEEAHCLCRSGWWRCDDPLGPMDAGMAPRCIEVDASSFAPCPASMAAAQGGGCDEIQRACFYEGELCTDGVTKLDYCVCLRGASGDLTYACAAPPCGPAGYRRW